MKSTMNDRITHAASLIIGQTMVLISVFSWNENGRYTTDGAVTGILAMVFWAYGFPALFALFREKNPWYARLGLLYALYGCLGGIAFGFEGLYFQIFGVSDKIGVEAHSRFPLQMNLVLFWAGPAFPLTFIIFGTMYMIRKIGPWWIGLLFVLGGLAFPVSRISRTAYIAHVADLLLLIPLVVISLRFLFAKYPHETRAES